MDRTPIDRTPIDRTPVDRVTISDVARQAGVSTMTVSRVINNRTGASETTRKRVEDAIHQLRYRPNGMARGLKVRRSHTVGLIVPDITNPYFPEIVRGAEDTALEHGYSVFLSNVIEDTRREAETLALLEEKRVDGVILCSARLPDEVLLPLLERHRAAVIVNRSTPGGLAGSVRIDHAHGTREAVGHLLSTGPKHLAVLAGPGNSRSSQARVQGILAALASHHHPPPDAITPCPPTILGGHSATRDLLKRHPDTDALLCFNDLVAAGALQACAELSRAVPEDVAVVGFDDIPFARFFTPPLTTLRTPQYDIGASAMRLLFDRIAGRNKQMEIILKPELIVRRSTRTR